MKTLFGAILAVLLVACGPSSEDKKMAEKECQNFVKEQFRTYETKVFDVYSKKGSVVVEVGYQDRDTRFDSYAVRLCVFNREKGTITLPSPLNNSEWKK